MKKFIEKLIGRLEEISVENTCSDCPYKAKCDEVQEHITDETTDLCGATIKALSIQIVNQLAEEYTNDFCEWMQDDVGEGVYCTKCGQMHIFIDGSPEENDHEFCPYCGKKIKIAPYQPKGE